MGFEHALDDSESPITETFGTFGNDGLLDKINIQCSRCRSCPHSAMVWTRFSPALPYSSEEH